MTDRGGQRSVTKYERLATTGAFRRCDAAITGRTHQIRVRLAAKRRPIVVIRPMDPVYPAKAGHHRSSAAVSFQAGASCMAADIQATDHRQRAVDRGAHTGRHARARGRIRINGMSSAATARVRDALARQPRLSLATLPTPLYDATRLRDALGGSGRCPRILIKRDDLTTLGLGGNKARKLEYLVADAKAQGATTLITTGAVQSNHARMTAAAACVAGMRVCRAHLDRDPRSPVTRCRQVTAGIRLSPPLDPCLPLATTNRWSRGGGRRTGCGRTPYVPVGGRVVSACLLRESRDSSINCEKPATCASLLRQRLAGHAGGVHAGREVPAPYGCAGWPERRRAGEDRRANGSPTRRRRDSNCLNA